MEVLMPRFLASEHLRRPADFEIVYSTRVSVADNLVIIYGRVNALAYNRFGMSVSKKYGNAVHRNRIRRLYREAYRLTKADLPAGMDLIVIPRTRNEPTVEQLEQSMVKLLRLLGKRLGRPPGGVG